MREGPAPLPQGQEKGLRSIQDLGLAVCCLCSTFEEYLAAFFCIAPGGKGRGVVWLRADERVIAERSVAVVELRFSTVWLFG